MAEQPDGALLRAYFAQGDEAALAALVERHGGAMLAAARRKVDVSSDAEDAVQSAFVALLRQGRTLRTDLSLGGWLHTATVRLASKLNRTRHRNQSRLRKLRHEMIAAERPVDMDQIARQSRLSVLDEELASLPDTHREPLVLKYLSGLSVAETATRLGVSIAATESRLKRARALLRSRLARRGVSLSVLAVATRPSVAAAAAFDASRLTTSAVAETTQPAAPELAPLLPKPGPTMLSSLTALKLTTAAACLMLLPGSERSPGMAAEPGVIKQVAMKPAASMIETAIAAEATPIVAAGGVAASLDGAEPMSQSETAEADDAAGKSWFLGVETMPVEDGAKIIGIHRGSPADRMKLQIGDIITKVGDTFLLAERGNNDPASLEDLLAVEPNGRGLVQIVYTRRTSPTDRSINPVGVLLEERSALKRSIVGYDDFISAGETDDRAGDDGSSEMSDGSGAVFGGGLGDHDSGSSTSPKDTQPMAPLDFFGSGPIGGVSESEERFRHFLDEDIKLEFIGTPLDEALQYISEHVGMTVLLDRKSTEVAGVSSEEPVDLFLDAPLRTALRVMLREVDLTYTMIDEVVVVTTAADAEQRSISTRVYAIPEGGGMDPDQFVELLRAHCEGPDGTPATMSATPAGLVVTADWQTHQKIVDLNELLGKASLVKKSTD